MCDATPCVLLSTPCACRCILVEQKPLTAYEFRDVAEEEGRLPPNKERDKEDKLLERAFWSRCATSSTQTPHKGRMPSVSDVQQCPQASRAHPLTTSQHPLRAGLGSIMCTLSSGLVALMS